MNKIKLQLINSPKVKAAHARVLELQTKFKSQYTDLEPLLCPEFSARALQKVLSETTDPKAIAVLADKLASIKCGAGYSDLTPAALEAKNRANGVLSTTFAQFRAAVVQLLAEAETGLAAMRDEIVRDETAYLAKYDLPHEPVVSKHLNELSSTIKGFIAGLIQDAATPSNFVAQPNALSAHVQYFTL